MTGRAMTGLTATTRVLTARIPTFLARVAAALLTVCILAVPARAELHGSLDEALWSAWVERFVRPDGRVVDTGNGGISHSEGQGYGLVLAVAADDPVAFARIYAFTKRELMIRDDGLLAWRWEPGARPRVTDANNAADADLLVAWALHEAAKAGFAERYAAAGKALRTAILEASVSGPGGVRLTPPGRHGFGWEAPHDGGVVNPSYLVLPALDALSGSQETGREETSRQGTDREAFADLARGARSLLRQAIDGGTLADWNRLEGETLAPHSLDDTPPKRGHDAIRVPLHLAWTGTDDALLARWRAAPAGGVATIDVPGEGARAIDALLGCALDGAPASPAPAELGPDYYAATLRLLASVALSERRSACP